MSSDRPFASFVAHELRNPMSAVRFTLEALLAGPRDVEAYEQGIRQCLEGVKGMQTLVRKLLELAQEEGAAEPLDLEEVDVVSLVRACWSGLEERAGERGLRLAVEDGARLVVETDRALLERVIANALDNAVDYADRDSAVELTVGGADGRGPSFTLANASKGTRAGDGERVLEPFWRSEGSPSHGHHCGLGLTLVGRIVERLGGRLVPRTEPGRFALAVELSSRS